MQSFILLLVEKLNLALLIAHVMVRNLAQIMIQVTDIKIDQVICTDKGSILVIFYTSQKCWQFRLISHTGGIFGLERFTKPPTQR
jgi:hypothetical protein